MRPGYLLGLAYLLFALNLRALTGVEFASVLVRAAFFFAALFYIIKRGAHWPVIGALSMIVVVILCLATITEFPFLQWSGVLVSLIQVLTVYMFISVKYNKRDAIEILYISAYIPSIVIILSVFYNAAGIWPMFGSGAGGTGRLQGTMIPAFLAGFAACGLFSAVQLVASTQRGAAYALVLMNCLILLGTGARAPFAVGILLAMAFVLLSPGFNIKTKIYFPILAILIISILIPIFGQELVTRYIEGGTSGRDILWNYFIDLANQYYWTGIGYNQAYTAPMPHRVMVIVNTTAVHNDYIRIFVELGFPGSILFFSMLIFTYIYSSFKQRGTMGLPVSIVCILAFLAYSWFDNVFSTPSYYMLLVLGIVSTMRLDWRAGSGRQRARGVRPTRPMRALAAKSTDNQLHLSASFRSEEV